MLHQNTQNSYGFMFISHIVHMLEKKQKQNSGSKPQEAGRNTAVY